MKKLFDLSGRVVFVTGALGRLGVFWTRTFLDAGAEVLGFDRPGTPVPADFRALLKRNKSRLALVRGDVTRRSDIERARALARRRWRGVSVLVNNAGIDQPPRILKRNDRFEDVPLNDMKKTFDVNLFGAVQALQVFGEDLAASRRGSVINIGSLYAEVSPDQRYYDHLSTDPPFLKPLAYGASKAALVNVTKYLATLWALRGVRVNALSPGGVEGGQDDRFKAKYTARVPMGRMATLEDLRGPALFLASEASRYVTGINLVVDGGYTAW